MSIWSRWRDRRNCFHHDHATGTSWIRSRIIDPGKRFWCVGCGKVWSV